PLPGREGGEVPAAGGGGIEQARRGVPGGRGEGRERVALAAHLRVDVLRVDLGGEPEGPDQALGLEDVGADGVPVGEGREELVDGAEPARHEPLPRSRDCASSLATRSRRSSTSSMTPSTRSASASPRWTMACPRSLTWSPRYLRYQAVIRLITILAALAPRRRVRSGASTSIRASWVTRARAPATSSVGGSGSRRRTAARTLAA